MGQIKVIRVQIKVIKGSTKCQVLTFIDNSS
jgi:hypothetical protein